MSTNEHRLVRALVAFAGLVLFAATGAFATASLPLTPCHLDDVAEEVLCTTYEVFENREAASGRKIAVRVAVLPAKTRRPAADPLFLLTGGPGQAATELAALADRGFDEVRRRRDIVLVDLRGTGGSNPLDCSFDADAVDASQATAGAAACLANLAERADVRFYTSAQMMDDLDDVRSALGYDKINLWGGSYGTRMALVYIRRHGEHVRSAILDSPGPFANKLPLYYARDAHGALELLFDGCAADEACNTAFPRLRERFDELLVSLEEKPYRTTMPHPQTGALAEVVVDRTLFVSHLRNLLYMKSRQPMIPYLVERAADGDFAPFLAASIDAYQSMVGMMHLGMTFSVLCSEDVARIRPEEEASAVEGTFYGRAALDTWHALCDDWPRGTELTDLESPLQTDAAILILSGELDPVCPPSWGEGLAAELPTSRHVVVPGAAHVTSGESCVQDVMNRFIEVGSTDDLDISCIAEMKRPPFVVAAYGTNP